MSKTRLALPSLGKQCGKNGRAECHNQNDGLGLQDSGADRETGVAKMTKLAQGLTDLHSKRGAVDRALLASLAQVAGGSANLRARIMTANTAAEAFALARSEAIALGDEVAGAAQQTAERLVEGRGIAIEIVLFDRDHALVGRAPFRAA